ncbi:MAG: Cof-type HAD-IIB family hydrolase [Solobacterium sp.]|nr:Cof-type HAD-IIB family hydrolase [Solobacterium sp.]
MNYKALIADIDGTLSPKGEPLLPNTKEALIRLHNDGVEIGLATGRPLDHRISDRAKEWGLGFSFDVLIGMNGGELWDRYTNQIERVHMLSTESLKDILGFMLEEDVNAQIFADGYDLVKALRNDDQLQNSVARNHSRIEYVIPEALYENPACKIEFHYDVELEERIFSLVEQNSDPRWHALRTFPGTIEFMDPHTDKGNAMAQYLKHSGISAEEVIACGDMENDIGMMKMAGLGICLVNGSKAAREAADIVTEYPVTEDGLGRTLLKHLYGEER